MAQVISPVIVEKIVTETVQGEVTLHINLNIKIDQEGKPPKETTFLLPDMDPPEKLISFGKDV